jgi:two-component system invasion response regulator UvrY
MKTVAPPGPPSASYQDALQQFLDRRRQRFAATFASQCDSIRNLVDNVAAMGPKGPVTKLRRVTHRLSGLAGTIGFSTVSARASELEDLAEGARSGAFDAALARDVINALRKALAKDLAGPERADVTTPAEAAVHVPVIRVLIVDDHAVVRCGLLALLAEAFHGAKFGEASDARQALEQLRKHEWDIVLLDLALPGKSGLDLLKELKVEWPTLPVLVLSGSHEDQFALRVLKAGAGGYMTKASAPEELAKAVGKILAGGRYVSPALAEKLALGINKDFTRLPHETLSDREYEVMLRIAAGLTVTEIADGLSLSAKTISTYRTRILEKLGVKNSAEIVQYALRNGLT